jgi:hypothetical protein
MLAHIQYFLALKYFIAKGFLHSTFFSSMEWIMLKVFVAFSYPTSFFFLKMCMKNYVESFRGFQFNSYHLISKIN